MAISAPLWSTPGNSRRSPPDAAYPPISEVSLSLGSLVRNIFQKLWCGRASQGYHRYVKTSSPFEKSLSAAFEHSLGYLKDLDTAPVDATVSLQALRARLTKSLQDEGMPPEQVVADLIHDAEGGIVGSAGGRFFAWVVGGALPAALAADWLTSVWDQNAGIHASGPAAALVEEISGAWLADLLGLPATASFAFVTGCQVAHVTCLAAARHALLERRGWNVARLGLSGSPAIRILTTGERHGSFERAVRLLGLGLDNIVSLPSEDGKMSASALERALTDGGESPTIVLLMAGDLIMGSYDDFEKLIPIARRHNAWVHVDGAFGSWAAASPNYRQLTRGVEAADSWATDGHKWLNVPYDCGYAFVADPMAHRAAMSHREPYLTHHTEARDQMDWNPEWSRRARGFATYAALRQLGRSGVAALVDQCCEQARALVQGIGALPGAEAVCVPTVNMGLVRFLDGKPDATEEDHDRQTDRVIARINTGGEAYFGGTTWRGRRGMRISVSNWQTTSQDVERVIRAVQTTLQAN